MRPAAMAALTAAIVLLGGVALSATPQQRAYWWQDELRTAAFAVSKARTGRVAQWPRMHVAAGSATMPLPAVTGEIRCDGKLDEPAWAAATSFPLGPLFGPWRTGPFLLTVRACRIGRQTYLAVESPVDLRHLGSLSGGELFHAGQQAYRAAAEGNARVMEIALPAGKGGLSLTFSPELVRRTGGGKPPPELTHLGIDRLGGGRRSRRGGTLWLTPLAVKLIPADVAVQLQCDVTSPRQVTLSHRITTSKGRPAAGKMTVKPAGEDGFFPYVWQSGTYRCEGFFYVEPIGATLAAAEKRANESARPEIAALAAEAAKTSPADRSAWRALYCRARALRAKTHLAMLDAPMLFVKQHPYYAAHIYDDYYPWHPGGGIYILDNPHNPAAGAKVRAVIGPETKPTLGGGVYRDAEVHWDAQRVLFAYKDAAGGNTSIYEISLTNRKLRRLTDPAKDMADGTLCASASNLAGHHDITPAYLGDDRIAFTSTRARGLVPCFNSTVDTLHVMNADGSGIRSISVNNVNEFDPAAMPDGRIVYGRWEYVDKTALYMQSLWTVNPDGTNETSLFANNLAKPTAVLDVRPVPGSAMVVASLTPHNGQPVGAIGMIDAEYAKNDRSTVTNFTPEYPVAMDQGLGVGPCDPWPLSRDDVLISNNAIGGHGIIELLDRRGHRELVHCDAAISCYSPMLVKPRPRPVVLTRRPQAAEPARFAMIDVYQGLAGVKRGEVKYLRVIEETSRSSGLPPGGRWWNQAFLVSWQGAYIIKNFLGVVPVEPDGSAHFEAPPGKALYFQALDADRRQVQSMRTFVQAVPGVTRTCIGCHENKFSAPVQTSGSRLALRKPAAKIRPESWGSGYLDYPTMVQPVLDEHCHRCHGGKDGIAGGLDFSGGWTWAFNISYETFLKNTLSGFLRCHNGDVTSSVFLPPRTLGSSKAPLADVLVSGHKNRIPKLARADRDLIFAWMDGNSNYYGTWDYTATAVVSAITGTAGPLSAAMGKTGCNRCHRGGYVGNDWVNLRRPEYSRILRAPLAKSPGGTGLAWCRDRKPTPGMPLVTQRYMPPDVFRASARRKLDLKGKPHVTFASTKDAGYQEMLAAIRRAQSAALATPRIDMPEARILPGMCRALLPARLPPEGGILLASVTRGGSVELQWPSTAEWIGPTYEIHRAETPNFAPAQDTLIATSTSYRYLDPLPPSGRQHYAILAVTPAERGRPIHAVADVPRSAPPPAPVDLRAEGGPGEILLRWNQPAGAALRYNVYRTGPGETTPRQLNGKPIAQLTFADAPLPENVSHTYVVRAVDGRGTLGQASKAATASAKAYVKEPMFIADLGQGLQARLHGGGTLKGRSHGTVKFVGNALDVSGGYVTFPHHAHFRIGKALTVECWVRIDKATQMPVVLACGSYNQRGWFLQLYQGVWRWHVGTVSCDGGRGALGKWTHLVCTYNGQTAEVFQDGKRVARTACIPRGGEYGGPLVVGQYSTSDATFQVMGRIAGVKIYRRAVSAAQAAGQFKAASGKSGSSR